MDPLVAAFRVMAAIANADATVVTEANEAERRQIVADWIETDTFWRGVLKKLTPKGHTDMDPKSIFASKTFWANVLGAAMMVAGSQYVPAEYGVPILAVLNIVLRFVSSQPVTLTGK